MLGSTRLVLDPSTDVYPIRVPQNTGYLEWVPHFTAPLTRILLDGHASLSGLAGPPIPLRCGRNDLRLQIETDDGRSTESILRVNRSYPTLDWVRVLTEAPWTPRDSHGVFSFHDSLWVCGGYTPALVGDVWTSVDGVQWLRRPDVCDTETINLPVRFIHEESMWLSGVSGFLYRYTGGRWARVGSTVPTWAERYGRGYAAFKDAMWVMGGTWYSTYNDVWRSADGVEWSRVVEEAPWSPRSNFGMVATHDSRLWVLGGARFPASDDHSFRDVWSTGDGLHWDLETEQAPWPGRLWGESITYRERLWVMGGFRAPWQNLNDVWYSRDGRVWCRLQTETIWSERHAPGVVVHQGGLWVLGGNSWPLVNDVWVLDIPGLVFLTQPVTEVEPRKAYCYHARADFQSGPGPVRYRLLDAPAWMKVDAATGVVHGTPVAEGIYVVRLEGIVDGTGENAIQEFTLYVEDAPGFAAEPFVLAGPGDEFRAVLDCPEIGACCHPDGTCIEAAVEDCPEPWGWRGPAMLCDPNPCPDLCPDPELPAPQSPPDGEVLPWGMGATVATSISPASLYRQHQWELYRGALCEGEPYRTALTMVDSVRVWPRLPIGTFCWRVRGADREVPDACPEPRDSPWSASMVFSVSAGGGHCDYIDTNGLSCALEVGSVTRNGGSLGPGDIVAAFDTTGGVCRCVGATLYEGDDPPDAQGGVPIRIEARGEDPLYPLAGFREGSPVVLRLCTVGGDTLCAAPGLDLGLRYSTGERRELASVDFRECIVCQRETTLNPHRWEWIATGLRPGGTSLTPVLEGLQPGLRQARDLRGWTYTPGQAEPVGEPSAEGAIAVLIENAADTLVTTGFPPGVRESCVTLTPERWSLVPYTTCACDPRIGLDAVEAFAPLGDCVAMVKDSRGGVWIPELDLNTIGRLDPRRGYLVLTTCEEVDSLCFPDPRAGTTSKAPHETPASAIFSVEPTGLPEFVVVTAWDGGSITSGDEIGLFADDRLVGWARMGESLPLAVPVWEQDQKNGLHGFRRGSVLTAMLHDIETGHLLPLIALEPIASRTAVLDGFRPYLPVRLQESGSPVTALRVLGLRPNPSPGSVSIRFAIPGAVPTRFQIYDAGGRFVRALRFDSTAGGVYEIQWDGLDEDGHPAASGVYFLRNVAGAAAGHERIMILR